MCSLQETRPAHGAFEIYSHRSNYVVYGLCETLDILRAQSLGDIRSRDTANNPIPQVLDGTRLHQRIQYNFR